MNRKRSTAPDISAKAAETPTRERDFIVILNAAPNTWVDRHEQARVLRDVASMLEGGTLGGPGDTARITNGGLSVFAGPPSALNGGKLAATSKPRKR